MKVQGVGTSHQEARDIAKVSGRLRDGMEINYEAPMIPGWQGPALLGLKSLERQHAIIDCRPGQRKLYLGANTRIDSTSATQILQLETAISGHLMLPVSCFSAADTGEASLHFPHAQEP